MAKKIKKRYVLTIDVGQYKHEWEVNAMCNMIRDYFDKNDILNKDEDVIIWPLKGEMKIFWLDGDPDDVKDVKDLEKFKDRLKPVMEITMSSTDTNSPNPT